MLVVLVYFFIVSAKMGYIIDDWRTAANKSNERIGLHFVNNKQ